MSPVTRKFVIAAAPNTKPKPASTFAIEAAGDVPSASAWNVAVTVRFEDELR